MRYRWWFVLAGVALYYLGVISGVALEALVIAVAILHIAVTRGIIAAPRPPRIYPEGQEPDAAEWKSLSGRSL